MPGTLYIMLNPCTLVNLTITCSSVTVPQCVPTVTAAHKATGNVVAVVVTTTIVGQALIDWSTFCRYGVKSYDPLPIRGSFILNAHGLFFALTALLEGGLIMCSSLNASIVHINALYNSALNEGWAYNTGIYTTLQ